MLFKSNQMPPVLMNNPMTGQSQQGSNNSSLPVIAPIPVPAPNMSSITNMNVANTFGSTNQDIDLRAPIDPRGIVDPRSIDPRMGAGLDPRMSRNMDQDMRSMPNPVPPPLSNSIDPRNLQRGPLPQQQQPAQGGIPFQREDPRQRSSDPRLRSSGNNSNVQQQQPGGPQAMQMPNLGQPQIPPQQNRLPSNGIPSDASDHEKAALIMQVLQLSDEQIAMLPPEQRSSIMVLKEQIAKSTQR